MSSLMPLSLISVLVFEIETSIYFLLIEDPTSSARNLSELISHVVLNRYYVKLFFRSLLDLVSDLISRCYCTASYWPTAVPYMGCRLLEFSYTYSSPSSLRTLISCNSIYNRKPRTRGVEHL